MSRFKKNRIMLGCENLLENHLHKVKNRKMGLITNQTGVDGQRRSVIDLFHENPDINLTALFAPEHGIGGDSQAGQSVPFSRHVKHDLPIYSLYGQDQEQESHDDVDMDAQMRSFDTMDDGKMPDSSLVDKLDVLVFDIQDVGTRIYTYIATMAYCMKVCAEKGVEFIVLDRPNPINGIDMEGPVLEYPTFSSFVGLYPIPIRHGMTVGELAGLFNERYLPNEAELAIIPMKGWAREMWFDQTGLDWIPPSPNMPTILTATVYPGQVFLEGTNISEGRGTEKPFEFFGAPWINGKELKDRLDFLSLPGIKFCEVEFTPVYSKYKYKRCRGIRIHVEDRNKFQPFCTTLHIIRQVKETYPEKFIFHPDYFDRIVGSSSVRREIESGLKVVDIVKEFGSQIDLFSEKREPYLLYGERFT